MKESLLDLDRQGILAYDDETEKEYYLRGHRLKFATDFLEEDVLKSNIKKEFGIEVQDRFKDKYANLAKALLKEDFELDFSWVKVYYAKLICQPTDTPNKLYVVSGQTLLYYSNGWYDVPITVLVNSNLIAMYTNTFKTLTHELLHIPRAVFKEPEIFNEEFANYYTIKTFPLTAAIARKKIEDETGKDAKPILARISLDEMVKISYYNKSLKDLANKNLRLKIIAEKLGL